MAVEDSKLNPPPPGLVTPGSEGGMHAQAPDAAPAPVQNPAFHGPPGAASPTPAQWPGGGFAPVEEPRRRSDQPPATVATPQWGAEFPGAQFPGAQFPGAQFPAAAAPGAAAGPQFPPAQFPATPPPVVVEVNPAAPAAGRRGRFNQTLALVDFNKPSPTGPAPAPAGAELPGAAMPPGAVAPPAAAPMNPQFVSGDAVLRQAPGTEFGGGSSDDPNATAAVRQVPPDLARVLEEQQRANQANAAKAPPAVGNQPFATPAPTAQSPVFAPPMVSPPIGVAAYAGSGPAMVAPPPAIAAPPMAVNPIAAPPGALPAMPPGALPYAPNVAMRQPTSLPPVERTAPGILRTDAAPAVLPHAPVPAIAHPAFASVAPGGMSPPGPTAPQAAQWNPHPNPSPVPGAWAASPADAAFQRSLANLPGPRAPGQSSSLLPAAPAPAAPQEPTVAIKWAALIAVGTFALGVLVGVTLYSAL
jgi:hypothetical protein